MADSVYIVVVSGLACGCNVVVSLRPVAGVQANCCPLDCVASVAVWPRQMVKSAAGLSVRVSTNATVASAVVVDGLVSITVTVYDPGESKKVSAACQLTLSMEYW